MLQGLFGNATEVNARELEKELAATLIEGETIIKGFKIIRDLIVFTDKRLILIDKQGMTGKKVEYHSILYKSISHFSVETGGTLDLDAELKIYISGNAMPIKQEFKKGTDIVGVQKMLAQFVLK
jgi:hypothetical protein